MSRSSSLEGRILVVDDVLDAATSLAMLLQVYGAQAETARDGLEALEAGARFRPEVILMDIGMPRMDGYEAARRIRKEPWGEEVILVALTGWGQERDVHKAREAGFDGHALKPVEPERLIELIASLRARRR